MSHIFPWYAQYVYEELAQAWRNCKRSSFTAVMLSSRQENKNFEAPCSFSLHTREHSFQPILAPKENRAPQIISISGYLRLQLMLVVSLKHFGETEYKRFSAISEAFLQMVCM